MPQPIENKHLFVYTIENKKRKKNDRKKISFIFRL